MTAQIEFWSPNDQQKLVDISRRLDKIERCEQGLFKRIQELKKERILVEAIVEDINYNQVYG